MPASKETVEQGLHYVHQDGQRIFRFAIRTMTDLCSEVLKRNNLSCDDIAAFVPHQANRRIIFAVAERLGIPADRVIINIENLGNTAAASIPLAAGDAVVTGRLKRGDLVLFAAVGAGFSAGVNLWRWEI